MTTEQFAVVFPGQGSQKVGMLADFSEVAAVRDTFSEASEVLGYDLWDLAQAGPQEKLNQTETTQPLMLTASFGLWRLWTERTDFRPAMLAGHSLGEWTALVAAQVVNFRDAVSIVRNRGRYMQEAVPQGEGAMAAILGLDDEVVETLCREASADGVVVPVNYNSPGQLVIAGHAAAVDVAIKKCADAGAKRAMLLPVSAPFHTPLMKPAADRLAKQINETAFKAPVIPVVHNVHAKTENDPAEIQALMIEQISQPVRWVDCVETIAADSITQLVECGPGKVLGGLTKRIDRSLKCSVTETVANFDATVKALAAGEVQ